MSINILPDKHIGLVFQPRSGSSVLREFLSSASRRTNTGEMFNFTTDITELRVSDTGSVDYQFGRKFPKVDKKILYPRALNNIALLDTLADKKIYTVFGILPRSYSGEYPQLSETLASTSSIQFIRLVRADVLYSCISVYAARKSELWHNKSTVALERSIDKFKIDIDVLSRDLESFVSEQEETRNIFGDPPVLYYEQFQFSPGFLYKCFDGIPKKMLSLPTNKFSGNHKELVENLNEVEHFYEQFVNDHREHFPQYFGKLPHIQIPACQGRQPRDLSLQRVAI